jgi:hypothetical protein
MSLKIISDNNIMTDILTKDVILIDRDENINLDMIQELRDKALTICGQHISESYIIYTFKTFRQALLITLYEDHKGPSSYPKINSFVMFHVRRHINIDQKNDIFVYLLCNCNKGKGFVLLNYLIEYARKNNCSFIELESIAEEKVVNFYKNNGFIIKDKHVDIKNNKINSYSMILDLE